MEFIYVLWKHSFIDEPIILISEIMQTDMKQGKLKYTEMGKSASLIRMLKSGIQGYLLSLSPVLRR